MSTAKPQAAKTAPTGKTGQNLPAIGNKAVAKNPESEVPDYLREAETMGDYEGFDQSELTMPMLMIAQDGNPLCKRGHDQYINGLNPGDWFNTLDHTIYGQSVKLCFIDYVVTHGVYTPAPESKFIRPFPESEYIRAEKFLQLDRDKRGMVDTSGTILQENEVIQERHRIMAYMPDQIDSGIIVVYLKPGSFTAHKLWRDEIHKRGLPHHKAVWELPLVLDNDDAGHSWYNFAKKRDSMVRFVRWITPQELQICDKIYKEFNRARVSAAIIPDAEGY